MIDGATRLESARCHDGQTACLREILAFRRVVDISGKPQDGLVGNLTYRYLDMVAGKGPNLDRREATLAYRWWAGDVGFDIGLT